MKRRGKYLSYETLVAILMVSSVFCAMMIKLWSPKYQVINPISIEIPIELQKEPEIAGFIKSSINTVNYWSEIFNNILNERRKLTSEKSKSTIYRQVKLINLSEKYLTEQNQFGKVCESIYQKADKYANELEQNEKEALNNFVEQVSTQERQINSLSHSILLLTGSNR